MESNVPPVINPPPVNPPTPPPAFNYAPYLQPRRGGTGWKVFALLLLVLLVLSLILNFRHGVRKIVTGNYNKTYGPKFEEATVRDGESTNKIVVIPVEGIITGSVADGSGYSMVALIKAQLRRARYDHSVKAVLLKVNSPGGEVLASDEIANAIKDFQTNSSKPVIVSMGSLAASGGYYISAPCDYIVANELTITGSIGVIMHGFNYRGLLDKIGVRPDVFKSGKYKDMMSGTKSEDEISPEERQMVQNLINETFEKFKSVVADGRSTSFNNNHQGRKLNADWADYADGRILSGKEAYRLGFVDDIGDFDIAVQRAEHLSKTSGCELVEYQPMYDISSLFRMFSRTDVKSVKLDMGMNLPKLQAGYLYFLLPTYLY